MEGVLRADRLTNYVSISLLLPLCFSSMSRDRICLHLHCSPFQMFPVLARLSPRMYQLPYLHFRPTRFSIIFCPRSGLSDGVSNLQSVHGVCGRVSNAQSLPSSRSAMLHPILSFIIAYRPGVSASFPSSLVLVIYLPSSLGPEPCCRPPPWLANSI